jgi:ubiquitin carboxyl-terminal hydrolase 48
LCVLICLIKCSIDELSDQKTNVQHIEEGFRGTLLTANISSQVV